MQIHSTLDWEAHNIHNLQEKAKKCIKPCFNSTISFLQNDHINYLHIYNPGPTQSRSDCRRGKKTCSFHATAAKTASATARRRHLPLQTLCVTWKCGDIQDLKSKQVLHLKCERRERAEIPGYAAAIRTERCSKNVCLPASRSGAGKEPWRDHSRAQGKPRRSQTSLLDKVFHFRWAPTRGRWGPRWPWWKWCRRGCRSSSRPA